MGFYMSQDTIRHEKWDSQLRKGTLELVVLASLNGRQAYGLELLKSLQQLPTMQLTEGTLYPLLDRLKREGLIAAEWYQEGDSRPRKYFQLTEEGEIKLAALTDRWRQSVADIEYLLDQPGPDPLFEE
jgi:PadR family transcriptional regulator PadR